MKKSNFFFFSLSVFLFNLSFKKKKKIYNFFVFFLINKFCWSMLSNNWLQFIFIIIYNNNEKELRISAHNHYVLVKRKELKLNSRDSLNRNSDFVSIFTFIFFLFYFFSSSSTLFGAAFQPSSESVERPTRSYQLRNTKDYNHTEI